MSDCACVIENDRVVDFCGVHGQWMREDRAYQLKRSASATATAQRLALERIVAEGPGTPSVILWAIALDAIAETSASEATTRDARPGRAA